MKKKFFVYTINQTTISPNSNAINTIIIGNEPFLLTTFTGYPNNTSDIRFNIRLTSTSYDLFSNPIPMILLCGDGREQFIIENFVLNPRESLTITLQNTSTTSSYNVDLALIGYKLI